MNRIVDYLRGLVADANLAAAPHHGPRPARLSSLQQNLDHPTYLRRGLVIADLGPACELHERPAATSLSRH